VCLFVLERVFELFVLSVLAVVGVPQCLESLVPLLQFVFIIRNVVVQQSLELLALLADRGFVLAVGPLSEGTCGVDM